VPLQYGFFKVVVVRPDRKIEMQGERQDSDAVRIAAPDPPLGCSETRIVVCLSTTVTGSMATVKSTRSIGRRFFNAN